MLFAAGSNGLAEPIMRGMKRLVTNNIEDNYLENTPIMQGQLKGLEIIRELDDDMILTNNHPGLGVYTEKYVVDKPELISKALKRDSEEEFEALFANEQIKYIVMVLDKETIQMDISKQGIGKIYEDEYYKILSIQE